MVRETRHLWVGNLPDNIREDRIREHFKRYGRVQSVKLLGRGSGASAGAGEGTCATVAFMDIKSAAKAHNADKLLDERAYTTEYYEPAAIPTTASAGSSPAGSGYSASSGSVSSASRYQDSARHAAAAEEGGSVAAAVGSAALAGGAAAAAAGAAAGSVSTWRGTNDSADRGPEYHRRGNTPVYCAPQHYRRAYPPAHPPTISPGALDRTPHHRWYACGTGESSAPSTPGGAETTGGGSVSGGGGTRRRRRSGSGAGSPQASSRSSSSSGEPSSDSRASTPGVPGLGSHRNHTSSQWSSTSGRPLAICVRNLPARSSDSSLKDGLYHEYKKHGKVAWVKVVGMNAERFAVVRFKKPSDVEKALEVSQDKLFFGCKISVAPHQGTGAELEDGEPARPYETDLDENHPKATRTLFIGNLEKDVTVQQLRDKFKHFGRIIEIDVKKQSGGAGYAFCQYASISSVVEAIRAMDGEYVGSSRVKLGFGKSMATTCVWIDGLTEQTEKQVLGVVSRCGTATSVCVDRSAGAALVHFEQAAAAAAAVRELRRVAAAIAPSPAAAAGTPGAAPSPAAVAVAISPAPAPVAPPPEPEQRRLVVDFASRECQDAFYEQLEKHGGNSTAALATTERTPGDHTPRYTRHDSLSRYEVGGSTGGSRSRAASYNRTSARYALSDHYDVDYDRRYRVYEEFGSSSPADLEGVGYEETRSLQSVVVASPRRRATRHHRRRSRDSTPDEQNKVRKERHRSSGGSGRAGEVRHRSRSGSRRRRTSDAERRRHRRRREESGAESRAGTPLRDELPEGPAPADPRRPPATRDRSHLPMSLSLPKFAEPYLMRSTSSSATPSTPATAPASPPRAPSASSSSEGSAPHSPSLEERIRSLDEKYEKWSGSRAAAAEAAERGRFRHRLLDIDIKEVKPSDMVRSLLAKRSVFDEDSERLEGSTAFEKRSTSPSSGSPRSREPRAAPRALQYPFPTHPPPPAVSQPTGSPSHDIEERVPSNGTSARCLMRDSRQTAAIEAVKSEFKKSFVECSDVSVDRDSWTVVDPSDSSSTRPDGPRPNRTDRLSLGDKSYKHMEVDCKRDVHTSESGIRTRSSSTDKSHPDPVDKKRLEKTDRDRIDQERNPRREADRRRLDSSSSKEADEKKADADHENNKGDGREMDNTDNTQNESEDSSYEKMHSDIREQLKKDVLEEIEKSTLEMERQIEEQLQYEKESKPNETARKTSKNCNYDLINVSELLKEHSKEKSPSERIENEHSDKKKVNADKLEQVVLEGERLQKPQTVHIHNEKIEKETFVKDAADKLEKECLVKSEKEKFEKQELNKHKAETERIEKDKTEKDKLEKEKADRDRAETERIENEKEHLRQKSEREAAEREKERLEFERLRAEKEKLRQDAEVARIEREKLDKEKQEKERLERERVKAEREHERLEKDKHERENDRLDEKGHRHDSKKERPDKDRKKEEHTEIDIFNHINKSRKDDKHKHDRHRKEHGDTKREPKKDKDTESKSRDISRKSSRDESSREMQRKDSSDSTTSRASHESAKYKEFETGDGKDSSKHSSRHKHSSHDYNHKPKSEKETSPRTVEVRKNDTEKHNHERSKESKADHSKDKLENHIDKQRHYSLDSQNVETKRKERLNSSSSLPANIGMKRRMSSQDILDCMVEESKKVKIENKIPERRDSKELKPVEKPKPKFNKGHFAKLLESKIKDDKKNQVKPPDDQVDWHNNIIKDNRNHNDKLKKSPKTLNEETSGSPSEKSVFEIKQDVSPRDLEFLATLELRSSEEDEKQKAIRKEMKERKRIQQLQQIQELQMQQDAMQQNDMLCKMKDEKKLKYEDRKKEAAREKRMSTERKSREEKNENKRRQRKTDQSTDTSDSDEPKKHSIFDIVDDGPTYISMYDKVKARSCKNMQKHEEEKRQEKIKAKFSQLKQSRAKREEKKRSTSWDEDSDSENDRKKFSQKYSMASSSEDERGSHSIRRETFQISDYEGLRKLDKLNFYNDSTNDEDPRNKLSRKNSRSRIMSDTSDDDSMKRKSTVGNHIEVKKEIFSDNDMQGSDYFMKKEIKKETYNNSVKTEIDEKFSKQSLINLFNDSPDDKAPLKKELTAASHMKATVDIVKLENDFKFNQLKLLCNDFSSEGELPTKFSEIRKKHKKKQKKQKSSLSEDDNKSTDYSEQSPVLSGDVRHRRNSEKTHKHSNRKDRRKEKLRDSIDSEECRDDKAKSKKGKKCLEIGFDNRVDSGSSNIRRDEKMENIFGPLSDDSDGGPRSSHLHNDFNMSDLPSSIVSNNKFEFISKNVNDFMLKDKEKEESRRRKERKRKEKRFISRDDDNSLDVDAAGKAIEASLFADSVPENDNQNTKGDPGENCTAKSEQDVFRFTDPDDSLETALINNELKQADKVRKDIKEKKKKKKKSKEDRQNRHHHHDKSDQSDRYMTDSNSLSVKDADVIDKADMDNKLKSEECKPDLQSPSLPRLTESPPPLLFDKSENASNLVLKSPDHIVESVSNIAIEPSPIVTSEFKDGDNLTTQMLNDPNESVNTKSPPNKQTDTRKSLEKLIPAFGSEVDADSENAVKSIAEFDKPKEHNIVDNKSPNKQEEKMEEKPRAVISQEETEDAVAALLGESFGGTTDSFVNCFDEVDENASAQAGETSMESENILEEDAEEMRQAVQNLNSELEIKPDTPLSENDLQIDTDTEEQDDSQPENLDKVPVTTVPVSASIPVTTVIAGEVKVTEVASNTVLNMPTSNKASTGLLNKALGFPRLNDTVNIKSDQIQTDLMISAPKRDIFHQVTSTATPVISNTWTLAGNKPHLINVHANHLSSRDEKSPHLTANIVQIKSPVSQSITLSNQPRPMIGTQTRMNHPFVINQMMRPGHLTNLQPPTIKIPSDHHPMYQKQSGVVISPRMTNDTRLQSPKSSPHSDMSSPRLTILSPTPQAVGLPSPNSLQQRSPGHVTVVRMQQPPLSPIQTMHLPHGAPCRSMMSPNRPNSVLVQTQAPPIHINRLPVTPILTPLSKPLHPANIMHHPKTMTVNTSSAILHPHKMLTEVRKADPRTVHEITDNSKFIITPSSLQPSTNPTVMAQNRLIMQNAGLHMANKILFNNAHLADKRDLTNIPFKSEISKTEPLNKSAYGQSPIIHIATVNQSTSPMVHAVTKPAISIGQEQFNTNRPHVSNVIHSVNSQRLLTTVTMTSVIQSDPNKPPSSVLSMAPIRSPSVLTKVERPAHVSVTSSVLSNVVMTPVMIKTSNPIVNKSINSLQDMKKLEPRTMPFYTYSESVKKEEHVQSMQPKLEEKIVPHTIIPLKITTDTTKAVITPTKMSTPVDIGHKGETDFEELLKDTTNEIKVTKDFDRKVEVNVEVGDLQTSNSKNSDVKIEDIKPIDKSDTFKSITLVEKPQHQIQAEPEMDKKDDSEGWSAKEVNIESVIKKVDDICNSQETHEKPTETTTTDSTIASENIIINTASAEQDKPMEVQVDPFAETSGPQKLIVNKRGARTARGRKSEKQQDRVQTRQISKPPRGSPASRRGRGGRAKIDKKVKTSGPTLSGDVYDFHDDSGDETHSSSQNKNESRPRLILTIKSPHTGSVANAGASAVTASISLAPRDQATEKPTAPIVVKDDKSEDFVSPALNTRKSRRLQEKDGSRNTVDEVIDDVIKNASLQSKGTTTKDGTTRRSTRQGSKTGVQEKAGADIRKSPRGGKRTRDRSSSETSMDSSDEKTLKKDDIAPPESKIPKLTETATSDPEKVEPEPNVTSNVTEASTNPAPAPAPIPIMKPPKKMISEISAKLASTLDTAPVRPMIPAMAKESECTAVISMLEKPVETDSVGKPVVVRLEKSVEIKMGQPAGEEVRATGVPSGSALEPCVAESGLQRRASDAVPPGRGAMSGVVDEAELRVQSPALPHRPPLTHRTADRATPILIRACESEPSSLAALEACRASPAQAGMVGGVGPMGAGGARAYRAPFVPSLPRGAHHPPAPPPVHPALAVRPHHPLKHIAIVGPQPQPVPAVQSRVTHTSVPSVSPQGSVTSDLVRSPPPAHQQTSPVTPGEGMYPHFSHQHYQVYQQHFRATQQDIRVSPSPYIRSPREAEGSEAPTPPLELRRPPPSARVPRPAHSPSPADRLISGRGSPPPAHGGAGVSRLPSALPPLGPPGPPHASQVPREADSLQMLLRRYPVMWQGLLALKNDGAAVQMHFVHGNPGVAGNTLPRHVDGSTPPLRIAQRMRLEPVQLEAVHRKMQMENEHCMLLALPCGRDHMDVLQQSTNLTAGFITYLQKKQAAGIVNVAPPGHNQAMYTVHIFPSCEFANENLNRIAPDLLHRVADIAHLLIVIATV